MFPLRKIKIIKKQRTVANCQIYFIRYLSLTVEAICMSKMSKFVIMKSSQQIKWHESKIDLSLERIQHLFLRELRTIFVS